MCIVGIAHVCAVIADLCLLIDLFLHARVPPNSVYSQPVAIMAEAQDFVARELSSPRTNQELTKWSSVFPWIDEDSSSSTYFELQAELPACMKG